MQPLAFAVLGEPPRALCLGAKLEGLSRRGSVSVDVPRKEREFDALTQDDSLECQSCGLIFPTTRVVHSSVSRT